MSSRTKNNTKASIPCHLRSPNIHAGYLLNEPFLQLHYALLMTEQLLFNRST